MAPRHTAGRNHHPQIGGNHATSEHDPSPVSRLVPGPGRRTGGFLLFLGAARASPPPIRPSGRLPSRAGSRARDPQVAQTTTDKKPEARKADANILKYGDGKADGKKSLGGSGEMIRFELPDGVTRVSGIKIYCAAIRLSAAAAGELRGELCQRRLLGDSRHATGSVQPVRPGRA